MTSPFRQPRAVWAVAFACVISFMGIGLVDPILPALSTQLHATPSQVDAAVHQLPRRHRGRDARHRLGLQPDRRQAHADRRPGRSSSCSRRWPARPTRSAASSASARAGAWATRCSSRPRWPSSSARPRGGFAGRDRPLRDGARARHRRRPAARRPCSATSAGAARSSASPCSWRSRWSPPSSSCRRHAQAGAPHLARRAAPGAAAPRPADHGHHGPALQLGLLHRCSATRRSRCTCRPPARLRLLRLGPAGRGLRGVRRAAAAGAGSAPPRRCTSTSRCSPSCSP